MEQFDAAFLAPIQKANDLHIYQRYAIEVQCDGRVITFDLRLEFIEMLRLLPSAQTNHPLSPSENFFDLQRHP